MKHCEEYTATEEVKKTRLLKTTCDKCGDVIPRPVRRERAVFNLEAYTQGSYPEWMWREGWRVDDLGSECAEWLRLTLLKAGVHITRFHNDWS